MKTNNYIKEPFISKINYHIDDRGELSRIFCQNQIKKKKINFLLKQVNYVIVKKKGTIKGMHFQIEPFAEIKLVSVLKGRIYDVLIDIRKGSKTFLKKKKFVLNAKKREILIIPKGFAHGFQTLTDKCEILYCHSQFYNLKKERSINPFDKSINIKWPIKLSNISKKDKKVKLIKNIFKGYNF